MTLITQGDLQGMPTLMWTATGLPCKLNEWWDSLNLMNFHHSHNTIPSFKMIVVFGNNYSVARQPKDTLVILCGNLLYKVILNKLGKRVMALPFYFSRLC
jgi:hypothetical protein